MKTQNNDQNQNTNQTETETENQSSSQDIPQPSTLAVSQLLPKPRSDASWNQLSAEQRAQLEEWLFENRLSYAEVCRRAKRQFNYSGSITSLRRFYDRVAQERSLAALVESKAQLAAIQSADVNVAEFHDAAMKIVAQQLLHHVTTRPESARQWEFLAKIILRHQADATRAEVKREENQIRQGQLDLSREKWADALAQRAEAQKATEAEEDARDNDARSDYAYNKWANRARYRMFGENLRPDDLMPESPEEEEVQAAIENLPFEQQAKERHRLAARTRRNIRKRVEKDKLEAEREAAELQAKLLMARQEVAARASADAEERERRRERDLERQRELDAIEARRRKLEPHEIIVQAEGREEIAIARPHRPLSEKLPKLEYLPPPR